MPDQTIYAFDHLVLKCGDVERSVAWYLDVLGLASVNVDEWRAGNAFFPSVRVSPDTIIDLIPRGAEVGEPNVDHFCLVADRATVDALVADDNVDVVDGPGPRSGARGEGWSVYIVDPDRNVVEVRCY